MGLRLRNHLEYRSSYKYGKLSFLNRLIYNLSSVGKLMKDRFDGKIVVIANFLRPWAQKVLGWEAAWTSQPCWHRFEPQCCLDARGLCWICHHPFGKSILLLCPPQVVSPNNTKNTCGDQKNHSCLKMLSWWQTYEVGPSTVVCAISGAFKATESHSG